MFIKSTRAIMSGIAATLVLLTVLAASRLFKIVVEDEKTEIVEIVAYEPPPEEPPMEEPEEEPEEQEVVEELSPPIPAMDLMVTPNLDAPALPVSSVAFTPEMSVDVMEIDRAPADLPVRKVSKPKISKSPTKSSSKPKATYKAKPKPTVAKAYYSPSELDGTPRETRQGRFSWPRSARGTSGSVSLNIEIDTSGRVTVLSVRSTTDSALVEAAKNLARGSRYTSPKKNGKPVKARFQKTYKLLKPR